MLLPSTTMIITKTAITMERRRQQKQKERSRPFTHVHTVVDRYRYPCLPNNDNNERCESKSKSTTAHTFSRRLEFPSNQKRSFCFFFGSYPVPPIRGGKRSSSSPYSKNHARTVPPTPLRQTTTTTTRSRSNSPGTERSRSSSNQTTTTTTTTAAAAAAAPDSVFEMRRRMHGPTRKRKARGTARSRSSGRCNN